MAAKKQDDAPISDVKSPDKVKPSATGRPIIVSTHPTLASDPMVVEDAATDASEPAGAPALVNRTAKVIKPLDPDLQAAPETEQEPAAAAADEAVPVTVRTKAPEQSSTSDPEPAAPAEAAETAEPAQPPESSAKPAASAEAAGPEAGPEPAEPAPAATPAPAADQSADTPDSATKPRDSEAEQRAVSAEEAAAEAAREHELAALIASGKYAVPINAVQRKRSRLFVAVATLIALLLAVVLFDVLLDTGLVKLPVSVPHTHLFRAA